MEIEVGEYVRIDKSSRFLGIGKIIKIVGNTAYVKMYINLPISFLEEDIKKYKHSKNIIDLIEVGDYVNGRKIERINDYGEHKRADFNLDFDDCDAVYNQDIKLILTKEQFASVEYKIMEEE